MEDRTNSIIFMTFFSLFMFFTIGSLVFEDKWDTIFNGYDKICTIEYNGDTYHMYLINFTQSTESNYVSYSFSLHRGFMRTKVSREHITGYEIDDNENPRDVAIENFTNQLIEWDKADSDVEKRELEREEQYEKMLTELICE